MKWRVWLCSPLFVLFALCVGGVIINQKNSVSALSVSQTIDSSNYDQTVNLCDSDSGVYDCYDYDYLIVELDLISGSYLWPSFQDYYFNGDLQDQSFQIVFNYDYYVSYNLVGTDKLAIQLHRPEFENIESIDVLITTGRLQWDIGDGYIEVHFTLTSDSPFGSSSPSTPPPSGSLSITQNGTYDVTNYAEAVVDVPPVIEQGDYHDDLVSINNAILIVPAVALVVYFFYAIYKMLLGGKTL